MNYKLLFGSFLMLTLNACDSQEPEKTHTLSEALETVRAVEDESTLTSLNQMTQNWKEDEQRSAVYAKIENSFMPKTLSVNSRTRLKVEVAEKGGKYQMYLYENARSGDTWDMTIYFDGKPEPGTYDIISEGSHFFYSITKDEETYTGVSKGISEPTGRIVFEEWNDKSLKGTLTFGVPKMEVTRTKAGGVEPMMAVGVDISFYNPNR